MESLTIIKWFEDAGPGYVIMPIWELSNVLAYNYRIIEWLESL